MTNLSVKITLDLTTELTLGELKAFVQMAESSNADLNEPLPIELDDHDELRGYSVYVDPARLLRQE